MERMTYGPARLISWTREFIEAAPAVVDADEVGAEAGLEAVRKGLPVIRTVGGVRYWWLSLGQLHDWLVREGKSHMSTQLLAIWAVQAGWERGSYNVGRKAKRLWRFPWHG